jgi:hypothetical protein
MKLAAQGSEYKGSFFFDAIDRGEYHAAYVLNT